MKNVSVPPGVIVERVGDDLMVIIPGNTDVVSLSGRVADILLDVQAGKTVDSNDPAVHDLITLGVLTAPGMSRRGFITAGAIGAGAGIAMMAMPAAAAASSGPGDEDDDEDDEVAGGFQPTGTEVPLNGFQWTRQSVFSGPFVATGTNYFFGLYPSNFTTSSPLRPIFRFKGFEDEVPASDAGDWTSFVEAFPAVADLSTGLRDALAEYQGDLSGNASAPDDFFYIEWGGTTYVLPNPDWFANP